MSELMLSNWKLLKALADCAKVKQAAGMELTDEERQALCRYQGIDGRAVTSADNGRLSDGPTPIDFKSLAAKYQAERGRVLTRPEGFYEYRGCCWWPATEKDLRCGIAEFLQTGQTREVNGQPKQIPCNRANIDNILVNLQSRNGYGFDPPCWLSGAEGKRPAGLMLVTGNGILDVGLAALVLAQDLDMRRWLGETYSLMGDARQLARRGGWEEAALAALHPHTHDLFTPYWLPYDFDPHATCPRWDAAVARLLPDPDVRRDFQMVCGYCLVPVRPLQAFAFLYGEEGTGKTFLATVLQCVLTGAYPETGVTSHNGPGNRANVCNRPLLGWRNRFTVKELARALANIVRDNPGSEKGWRGWEEVEGQFLDATGGGGTVTAETKYEADIPERGVTAFNLFCGNWLPTFMLTQPQLLSRLRLIPCVATVRGTEADDTYLARKIFDSELEGVFNWCLKGLGMLIQAGNRQLPQSRAGAEEIHRLRARQDAKRAAELWVQECLMRDPGGALVVEEVFVKYEETLRAHNCATLKQDDFKAAVMAEFGVECSTPQRVGYVRRQSFMGIAWRQASPPPPEQIAHDGD